MDGGTFVESRGNPINRISRGSANNQPGIEGIPQPVGAFVFDCSNLLIRLTDKKIDSGF